MRVIEPKEAVIGLLLFVFSFVSVEFKDKYSKIEHNPKDRDISEDHIE